MWNCPVSVCLRVGVQCQCNGFEFLGPNQSCQTTNPERLCGSVKHVSLWDCYLWESFWLPPHCPQRHTTWHKHQNALCWMEWRWCAWLVWVYACLTCRLLTVFTVALSLGSFCSVRYGMKYFNHQVPDSESGNTVHAWTCIERNYSPSVEPSETEVCFLHIHLKGTNVWLPKIHKILPEVDFESSRSPAQSESWNSPNVHCCAVFPTWK